MPHLPLRFGMVVVPAALTLAACGSTAINANYTPGPTPSSNSTAVIALPSNPGATKTTEPHHSASPTAHATHTSSPKKPTMPTSAPPTHKPSSSGGGGTHHVTSTAATITVTPSSNLADGQTVTIHGTHFKPSTQVIIIECVNKGTNTQQTDCTGNGGLLGIPQGFQPDANGTFTKTFVVHKSYDGIGGGHNTCGVSGPCIISVTDPNPNPSEEADAPINFR